MQHYYISHQVCSWSLNCVFTFGGFQRPLASTFLAETQHKAEFMLKKAITEQNVLNRPTNQHLDE